MGEVDVAVTGREPIQTPFGRDAWKKRPIAPGPVEGEPRAVRWEVATGAAPAGVVVTAPGTFGPLIQYGVLSRVVVEDGAVTTWLAEGQEWVDQGPRIRDALNSALDLEGWQVEA